MGSFHARNGTGELLARYSFLEPLLEGRRVLEIGAARATEGASALFLAERGAAAVLSIEAQEADLAQARRAGHHPFVQFHAAPPASLRAGTFDLVLLADGSTLAAAPDEVAGLRRLLAPGGRLVTAIPAGGAGLPDLLGEPPEAGPPAYETFVNALSDHFTLVEVAAQTATVGWVFGLASEDEPEIAMDGTLAGTPDTTRYVAIAGEEPSGLSGFTVVALPVGPLIEAARSRTDGTAGELEAARARAADAEAAVRIAEEAIAAERARLAELAAALAALEVERDGALHARASAVAEAEALRGEREQAIRARDAARAEADAAVTERDRAVEALQQREAEREALIQEHEASRAGELEAKRSREVALAEAVALGESLARSEALAAELARDRDAALAARDQADAEAAEHRLALDEARLANGALEGHVIQARNEGARLAARLQELERSAGDSHGLRARLQELEALVEAEKAGSFEVRAQLDRARAVASARSQELDASRAALATAEEERIRLEAALAERRSGALESEAALQAARSEAQAARAALEAALDRATRAETRNSELEETLEKTAQDEAPAAEPLQGEELQALRARLEELEEERLEEGRAALEADVALQAARSEAQAARAALEAALDRATRAEKAVEAAPASDGEAQAAQLAEAIAAREALETKLSELKESSDRKVSEARRAAYDAAAKAEAARRDGEAARKELDALQAEAAGAVQTAREWAQVREALEAQVAELNARLEAEAERAGILSAQHAEARAQLESASQLVAPAEVDERIRAAEERAENFARRAVEAEARVHELDAVADEGIAAVEAVEFIEVEDPDGLREQLAELKTARAELEKALAEARNAAETAEGQAAEIAAELQAVQWEKDELDQRLRTAQAGGGEASGDVSGLRDELASRMAELALQRREVERLEAVVASLSVPTEVPPAADQAELERKLAEALQRAADAEAALETVRTEAPVDPGEALRRASQERDAIAAQVAERDGKIARLQREVGDKTERLGRLAKELGELKAKGLGKIFR
jgi:chromosome segregation ATPase